jgi:hypothetical protein
LDKAKEILESAFNAEEVLDEKERPITSVP